MIINYLFIFLLTFGLSFIFTLLVKKIALKLKIIDSPDLERKVHKKTIPLLGGLSVFISFSVVLIYYSFFSDLIIKDFILTKHIVGILAASLIVVIGGVLDDKYNLKPKIQILFPLLAVFVIIFSGIGIDHIRNPFGGIISFNNWEQVLFYWQGLPYKLVLFADFFTLLWLMGMMYTTKLLDGLDGLVSGVTIIGSFIIFATAMSKNVTQPNTGLIAIILAGAFFGFLIFNWHPAKIFLGEGGALLAGLLLGVLAIISGSKVATTLLIMGIPILDVLWVIGRRIFKGKPVSVGDRKHLHFRLLDIGLSHRQSVIFLYVLTAIFGSMALFLQTYGKFIAFIILFFVMLILGVALILIYKYKDKAKAYDSEKQI